MKRSTIVWVVRGLLFLALLFTLVYFFISNSEQVVDINFFGKSFMAISIYWVVVVSFMVGFATSFIMAALREFNFMREIGRLKRELGARDKEIGDLRTLPLREGEKSAQTLSQEVAQQEDEGGV